ncbi:MAG: cation-transporting P-type ATPase, partial [Dehalococcoidales bacterium]
MKISNSQQNNPFWALSTDDALSQFETNKNGLTQDEAQKRLVRFGANLLKPKSKTDTLTLLTNQFRSPLVLILIFAAILSFFLGDPVNAAIILVIVVASGLLGFWQERGSTNA